ncbi:hypothetical protein S7711_08392, partial [Stachybotrys chartarum IBT 7711]
LHHPLRLKRAATSWASTVASSNIDTATVANILQRTITPPQQSAQPVTDTANMDYAPISPPESSDSSLPSQADPQTTPRKPIIGILGGGHFCRMLRQSAKGLPVELVILDRAGCPAKKGVSSSTPDNFDGSHETEAWVRELAAKVDIITVKHEHVNSKVLREIEKNGVAITVDGKSRMKKVEVHPSPDTISITQDKYALKSHLTEHGFYSRDEIQALSLSMGQLSTAVEAMSSYWGYPLFLKAQRPSLYNGGSFKIKNKKDTDTALAALRGQPRYLEKWLPVDKELAVSVERTTYDCEGLTYGSHVVETVYEDGICTQVFSPARIALDLRARALVLACNVVETFTGRGLFTVKMFVLENGKAHLCLVANVLETEPVDLNNPPPGWDITETITLNIVASPSTIDLPHFPVPEDVEVIYADYDNKPTAHERTKEPLMRRYTWGMIPGRKIGHVTFAHVSNDMDLEEKIRDSIELANKIRREAVQALSEGDEKPRVRFGKH